MKKIFSLTTGLLIAISSFSQLNEGKIKYNLAFSSSDPQMQAQFAMLQGSTMTMYFSPEFNRTELNMGMFMKNTTVVDIKAKETLTLMSGMVGNKAVKISEADIKSEEADVEFEKTNDTKKIAGYKCTKYILTTEDGSVVNYWVTDELTASKEGVKYMNDKIQGFPLEFEMSAQGMIMSFSATEVEKGLKKHNKKELFDLKIPEGYEVITPDDLNNMGGM